MKRTVKAWAQTCVNSPEHLAMGFMYWTPKEALTEKDYDPETQTVIPVTITYDDGRKPKRNKAKKR